MIRIFKNEITIRVVPEEITCSSDAFAAITCRKRPEARIRLSVVAALCLATSLSACHAVPGDDGASNDGETEQKINPSPERVENYWTPEQLRKAKPIEMPHPAGPPSGKEHSDNDRPGQEESESGPGSPGVGDIPPGRANILRPKDGISNKNKPTSRH